MIAQGVIERFGQLVQRAEGRAPDKGPLERDELAPALRDALIANVTAQDTIEFEVKRPMINWNRPDSAIDLVVSGSPDGPDLLVAELKAWDIGHQLFDLAKVACLLASGARSGFLVCVARQEQDFERMPGGELFPATVGERREHDFLELVYRHRSEWAKHTGRGGPEPTFVPVRASTTATAAGVELAAYPGNSVRAVEVTLP